MENLRLYEVDRDYINYLLPYAPHLFQNKKSNQQNDRKYVGVVLHINNMDYFAPLSSFKDKHRRMKETVDFIKIKDYAVINLNNMFPVPVGKFTYVDIKKQKNPHYRDLLLSEYRFIKSIQEKIRKNASIVYNHKIKKDIDTSLGRRCNDFLDLEKACEQYK